MHPEQLLGEFRKIGAIKEGHFRYHSGKHGSFYVDHWTILRRTSLVKKLTLFLADEFSCHGENVEVVVGPKDGGGYLAMRTAEHLTYIRGLAGSPNEVLWIAASELFDGTFGFQWGENKLIEGRNVLIVDDVITTGDSLCDVAMIVRGAGGKTVGIGALWYRGSSVKNRLARLGIKRFHPLLEHFLPLWEASECPLCQIGMPLIV